MSLTTTIVIPTYNRPKELGDCIRSLLEQSVLPTEILVVDDGDLQSFPSQTVCESAGIVCKMLKKDTPGLTASRNLAIDQAQGEIVFFLDDDVVLFPDYIERILDVFDLDTQSEVGGVGGWIANHKPLKISHKLRYIFDLIFLNKGLREGRILPSGCATDFGTTPFPPREIIPVDFLLGGVAAYRSKIFKQHRFSESYKGYGLGEDKDFSYRVAQDTRLMLDPQAQLDHFESPRMRYDKYRHGRAKVLYRHRFFNDHLPKNIFNQLCFSWAQLGYLLARTLIALLSFDREEYRRVAGIVGALRDIMRYKPEQLTV